MAKCHVVFFPFMAYGHSIPMADMAVLFASHGVQTTIITVPSTAQRFSKIIEKTINYHHQIALHIVEFKAGEAGNENPNQDQSVSNENLSKFFEAISTLQEPVEQFLQESQPDCIIADMFYPWTTKIAAKFNIPRIVFNGSGFFQLCVSEAMELYEPHKTVSSNSEQFIVPNLPHEITFTQKQLVHFEAECFKDFIKVLIEAKEAEVISYGVIFNSFYELEAEYVHHYREVMKRKAWHIGPVFLSCSNNIEDKFERGKKSVIDEHECLKWLEGKAPDSVIYICFGTLVKVTSSQIYEIALGLEACNEDFIWVINNEEEKSLPEGFEAKMKAKGKGMIIKGWAPQVLILDHESVGTFVTHCGWNSVLEGISGGVAMVAWPVMAEQFNNAKLVTDVLQIGIWIGDVEWSATSCCEGVKKEAIENALVRIMDVEEGAQLRSRARILKEKAKTAIKKGGSSYSDLNSFIEEIKALKSE